MTDCQHGKYIVGKTYDVNITGTFTCGICGASHSTNFMASYVGHELEGGQMCAAFDLIAPVLCGCGETIRRFWDACGDGWTSDLFAHHQRQSATVPASADTDGEEAA